MTKTELLTSYNNAGFVVFPCVGKKPVVQAWQKLPYDLGVNVAEFPENFGVQLTDEFLVIDVDPRNFNQNDKPHKRLFEDIGISFSELKTLVVRTGTGGIHIYLRTPPGTLLKPKLPKYRGIDFLGKGRYVVGAGSLHPDTKKPYEIIQGNLNDIKPAPETLLNIIRKTGMDVNEHIDGGTYTDDPKNIQTYIDFLKTAPSAEQGNRGDEQTYKVACQGRNLALSPMLTFELMLKHYNPRCSPPWTDEELLQKVKNGYKFAQGKIGQDLPEASFSDIDMAELASIQWDTTKNGERKKTLRNCVNYFLLPNTELKDALAFNMFSNRIAVTRKLPWHLDDIPEGKVKEWTGHDAVKCRYYLNLRGFDCQVNLIQEATVEIATRRPFHPVKDYMSNLYWDGIPRLDTWLSQYCGVKDTIYTREVARIALMQMVKRVYQPGCKADYVMVLEGPQGARKSSVFQVLAGEWFADFPIDPHSKDTVDAMQGKLIVEFAEMDVTRKAEVTALKAFITRQIDRVRFAYAQDSKDVPRQCVFMGSMNPDATNEYLSDTTGNRRFLPVKVGTIRLDELARDRDQLIAEAVQMVMKGLATWIIDKKVLDIAEEEQKLRQHTDAWQGIIERFLEDDDFTQKHKFTSVQDVATSPIGLKLPPGNLTRFHAKRIHECLKEAGWVYGTHRHPLTGKVMKAFKLHEEPEVIKEERKELDSTPDVGGDLTA
jgi:predicted P-loop ATPase